MGRTGIQLPAGQQENRLPQEFVVETPPGIFLIGQKEIRDTVPGLQGRVRLHAVSFRLPMAPVPAPCRRFIAIWNYGRVTGRALDKWSKATRVSKTSGISRR